jgi:hypothetical protein
MPRAAPQPEPAQEHEPMDIPEIPAEHEMAFEPHREAEQEQPEEYDEEYEDEECITLRRSDMLHFQETLIDIRSQIADLQRDARQDRLEVQEMFRAIMERLPPAARPHAPPPALRLGLFLHPLHFVFYFLYQHTVDSADFEFGGILSCVHILFFFKLCILC